MKNKQTRRKAIDCTLIRASESSPGYFKYIITIEDTNGNITKQPAYGVDMQDAISRLIWNERTEKVEKVTDKPSMLNIGAVLLPLILIIPSTLSIYYNNPYPILGAVVVILSAYGGAAVFRKYLDKGNFDK